MTYTRQLLYSIADQMGRQRKDMDHFISTLQKNWYDSKQSLRTLTLQDYDRFQIPNRLSTVIMQKVGAQQQQQSSTNNYQYKQSGGSNSMDIEQSLREYIENIEKKYNKQTFTVCINTMVQIYRNIRDNITNQKYRTLKKSNKKIEQLLSIQENNRILKYGGFEDHGSIIAMKNVNLSKIDECLDMLLKYHQGSKFNPYQASTISTDSSKPKFTGQTSVVYNEKLQQLQNQRNMIMSRPIKDRDIKIYQQKKGGELKPDAQWFDDRDATLQQRQYAENIKQKLKSYGQQQKFMNRRKQEYFQLAKKPIFSQTLIRVKMPDNWIFQCKFSPLQNMGDLVRVFDQFVQDRNLSYYLYMTPPVQKLRGAVLRQTFYDKGCVPKALFYFGTEDTIKGNVLRTKKGGFFGNLLK